MISLCNHSCSPNTAISKRIKDGSRPRVLYALRDISPGEEVCICYDSALLWLPESARRLRTNETWGFTCTCHRCVEERSTPDFESLTGLERYYDQHGRLTSGVVMHPCPPVNGSQPCVVDLYEEAKDFYGATHWRAHVARESSLKCGASLLNAAPSQLQSVLYYLCTPWQRRGTCPQQCEFHAEPY